MVMLSGKYEAKETERHEYYAHTQRARKAYLAVIAYKEKEEHRQEAVPDVEYLYRYKTPACGWGVEFKRIAYHVNGDGDETGDKVVTLGTLALP
jgi:hypothetical protein